MSLNVMNKVEVPCFSGLHDIQLKGDGVYIAGDFAVRHQCAITPTWPIITFGPC
jgi:hypothetical protein